MKVALKRVVDVVHCRLNMTAEALTALALALANVDMPDRARAAADRVLALYRRKGNDIAARQAEALLAEVAI